MLISIPVLYFYTVLTSLTGLLGWSDLVKQYNGMFMDKTTLVKFVDGSVVVNLITKYCMMWRPI